jgi:hypothetical protein
MHACKFSRIPQPITSTLILASKSTQDRPYPVKINIGKAAQPFLVQAEPPVLASSVRPALNHGLIRSSTLPAEAFVERERKSVPAAPSTEPMYSGEGHQLWFSNIAQQDQLMGSPEATY